MPQYRNEELNRNLSGTFRKLYDATHAWGDVTSFALALPGLVGYWPGSVKLNAGGETPHQLIDTSANGLHLNQNGDAAVINNGLAPTLVFDGTGDYFSHIDDTRLDILGTETIVASSLRGLTMMCWLNTSVSGASAGLIDKFLGTGNQRSYSLRLSGTGAGAIFMSTNGAATVAATGAVVPASTWVFMAGRFIPSTSLTVWVNLVTTVNTTSIPASIFNSTAAIAVGAASGGAIPLTGSLAFPVLCASALPTYTVNAFCEMTSPLFGVRL